MLPVSFCLYFKVCGPADRVKFGVIPQVHLVDEVLTASNPEAQTYRSRIVQHWLKVSGSETAEASALDDSVAAESGKIKVIFAVNGALGF